jgi:hypothetical protein
MSKTLRLIRTCAANGASHAPEANGFRWPLTVGAEVVALDWDPNPKRECGGGLHAIDPLVGEWWLLNWEPGSVAMVVEVQEPDFATRGPQKHRFRACRVVEVTRPGGLYDLLCRETATRERVTALVSDITAQAKTTDTAASGYGSRLAASGNDSQLAASGYGSRLAASGDDSRLAASGNDSQLAASGNDSQLAASGDDSRLAASGDDSRLAASGYGSRLAASGNGSRLAASGYGSRLAASGYGSRLAASGNGSRLAASGNDSLVMGAPGSTASAGEGGAIALAWYDGKRPRVSVAYVGENGIKPNTPYRLNNAGQFEEATRG